MLPNYIDAEVFAAFLESRRAHKAPFTQRAEKMLISKLMRHHGEGWDVNEALERATISGWKSIYPQVKRQGYDLEKERAAERAARDKTQIDASIAKMCESAVRRV